MKTMRTSIIWLILSLLLSGCGATLNSYRNNDGNKLPEPAEIQVYNESNQYFWVALEINNITVSPKDFIELQKNDQYSFQCSRRDRVSLVLRYFDQSSLVVKKIDTQITRQTRHERIERVVITDATLFGYATEDCVVLNVTNKTLEGTTNQGHKFVILPGSHKVLSRVVSGKEITFYWSAKDYPRRQPRQHTFTPKADEHVWFQDKAYGCRVTLKRW